MALQEQDELAPYVIQELELLQQGQEKGSGSYGAVYQVNVKGLLCIAKQIHAILLGHVRGIHVSDREKAAIQQRFREECILLSKLRHPNIVQFIGVHYGQTPEDLTLVMECVYTDLDKCLGQCSQKKSTMPLPIQLSILCDVSYGLLYLHSQNPPIIHRDLKASNILLTEDMRAKLADLGVSKILDLHPMRATAQTVCPGTLGVMPPEALLENPQYDAKLDDFSYGTLALHIVNHEFAIPFEVSLAVREEVQLARRRHAIEKMGADHCLYDLVIRCLQDDPRRRPTTAEICATLEQLSQQHPNQFKDILELYVWLDQLQLANMELQNRIVEREEQHLLQLRQMKEQLHQKDEQLCEIDKQPDQKEVECGELQQELQTLHQQEATVVPTHINTYGRSNSLPPPSPLEHIGPISSCSASTECQFPDDTTKSDQPPITTNEPLPQSFQFNWDHRKYCVPVPVRRGASTIHGTTAYFTGQYSKTVYSYHIEDKSWDSFPPCPVENFGIEVVNGLVTTVGGGSIVHSVRTLYTFTDHKWKEQLPPMSTGHLWPATVQSGKFLLVAGGFRTSSVEIMNTETNKWSTASSLPEKIHLLSAALCNDKLYLLGGDNPTPANKVFSCKLSDLLESTNQHKRKTAPSVWQRITDIPLVETTCAVIKGEVLAIGGRRSWNTTQRSEIYRYVPDLNTWELIGLLPSPRFSPIVVVLPGEKLMVVGGGTGSFSNTTSVEIGELTK